MRYLRLYIIDGFPAIAISYRPIDALHVRKRVYYKVTGSSVCNFFAATHEIMDFIDHDTGTQVMIVELKGEVR